MCSKNASSSHSLRYLQNAFISTVSSQTGCVDTFNISGGAVLTVEGGVRTCFRCLFDGAVNRSTTWILNSVLISPSDGTVTDGVLTIFDPATVVPSVNPTTLLVCAAGSQQYTVFLRRRGRHGLTQNLVEGCACVCMLHVFMCACVSVCVWMKR